MTALKELSKDALLQILADRGIKVAIHGCGCCGSPDIKIVIDDKKVYSSDSKSLESRSMQ